MRRGFWPRAAMSTAAALCLSNVQPAQAHRRDFPFTYDWNQPARGERELELKSTYVGEENAFVQEVELEFGLTKRFMVAPYLVFEKEGGGRLRYHEFKLESRYQLSPRYQTGRLLSGLYLEYARERSGDDEVEGKLIVSRFDRKGGNLSLNLIAERALARGADFERGYSLGYARPLGRTKHEARGGFEWLQDLKSKRINAGPTLAFAPNSKLWLVTGYAFALNKRRDGNAGQFRLNLEYEFD